MIVKPTRLGFLRRVSSDGDGHRLWITALGAFDMRSPGDFLTEAQLWQTAAPVLGTTLLDAGMPKPHAEVLMAGGACAPAGRTVRTLAVHLELGPIRKRLVVLGRRWWRYGPDGPLMTEPQPFERVPLGWNNAFGGPGCAENPLGKGADAKGGIRLGKQVELPMIEVPEALITDIEHRPAPAGFGPRAEDAPSRLTHAGEYDDAWLRDDFPGPGRGFDWRYYNVACPDQRTESEFRGDEPFRITSMHPEHTELRGRLPGFRVRAFARRGDEFEELAIRCDTVWLFPNALMGIVLFRGGIAVADTEASDVPHVMLAYERLHDPKRALAGYRTAFEERTGDPEIAALKLLDERPLKPERPPSEIEAVEEERRALAEEMDQRHEKVRAHAISNMCGVAGVPVPPADLFREDTAFPVEIPVVTPGELERMEADVAGLKAGIDALVDKVKKQGDVQGARMGQELKRFLPQAARGLDPRTRSLLDDRLSTVPALGGGDGPLSLADLTDASDSGAGSSASGLDDLFARAGEALGDEAGAAPAASGRSGAGTSVALRRARNRALGMVDEDDPIARVSASLASQRDALRSGAASVGGNADDALPALSVQGSGLFGKAAEVLQGSPGAPAAGGKPGSVAADPRLAYFDEVARVLASNHAACASDAAAESALDDAQSATAEACERLDASKVQARRSSPEPIAPEEPLSASDAASLGAFALELERGGEGLKDRDLAGADLSGADLAGKDLGGIFLEQAKLAGANLSGAKLNNAALTHADLTGADLSGADLTGSNLSGANLAHSRLRDARLDRARLFRSRFDGADLSGVSLSEASLIEASLADVRLVGAVVRDVQFVKCDLSRIALDGARLNNVVLVESDTSGFRAPAARFERCALIGLQAEDADLTESEFVRSTCIGDAKLGRARMSGLVSRGSGWRGADLHGADLTAARFDESDLGETNLTGTCLHRASFRRAILHKANAAGANFYGATLLEAQAREADFTRASLHGANLYSTDLTDARLALCDLTAANLALTLMRKPASAE